MRFLQIMLVCILLFSCKQKTPEDTFSMRWEMGENQVEPGYFESTFYLINNTKDSIKNDWAIFFNQKPSAVKPNPEAPISIEQINATYYKIAPAANYTSIVPYDTVKITYRYKGSLTQHSNAPEGLYCVWMDEQGNDLRIENIKMEAIPFEHEYQWTRKGAAELPYPYGERVYADNQIFTEKQELLPIDIFPSIKNINQEEGSFTFSKNIKIEHDSDLATEAELLKEKLQALFGCTFSENAETSIRLKKQKIEDVKNTEHYILKADNGVVEIVSETSHGIFNGVQTLIALLQTNDLPCQMNNMSISDFPDLAHRGFMLDVARNFTKKQNLLKLIDILSSYKVNVIHLHLADDEGWRLEIPGLEELTTVGATRGHTYDELDTMYPAYGGGWDPTNTESSANGFYTRQDFLDILKFATDRHIKVIPEIDLPGHARAAIKAMTARYHKYIATDKAKAEEYLLEDFSDKSSYLSAQSYRDNTINVAMPSVYTFVQKIVDEIDQMYKEAGLVLDIFHLGGDEVPRGAWEGSEIARNLMTQNKMENSRELKDYFLEQTIKILKDKNMQMGAWQEVALLPNQTVNSKFADDNVLSYCWSTVPDWKSDQIPYRLANAGYPIILCNSPNFYFDLTYDKHEDEPGAYWAGFVNEYNSFDALPYNIYYSVRKDMKGNPINMEEETKKKVPLHPEARKNIKGVQAQLWAETIRSFEMVEHYIFPKIFGLVERGWNAYPSWNDNPTGEEYYQALKLYNAKIGSHEMPRLAKSNVNFRIPLPGVIIEDGQLKMNYPIQGAKIYYTTDGSIPNEQSTEWTEAIACDAKIIRAKAFYQGQESAATRYYKK